MTLFNMLYRRFNCINTITDILTVNCPELHFSTEIQYLLIFMLQ